MAWLREAGKILWSVGWLVLIVTVVSAIIDQFLNAQLQDLLLSEDGGGSKLWLLAGASLLNSLIFPTLVSALCLFGLLRARGSVESLGFFFGRVINQLYIETLRAWGSTLRWGLLFVLPAFVRLFQLVFVPFVVAIHRPYELGEADALQISRLYVQKRWIATLAAVLVFYLVLPLGLTSFLDEWRSYDVTPMAAILCSAVDVFLAVLSAQIFFRLFESIRKEFRDESVLSVERN